MVSAAEQLAANLNFSALAKAEELKKRIWFTLGALLVYRFGTYIPLPGIDPSAWDQIFRSQAGGILGMFNMFSGGGIHRMAIFALNIMPYISASIIIQLMTTVSPTLEQLKKEGEQGRKVINQYTRYLTVVLAAFQAYGISIGLEGAGGAVADPGYFFRISTAITLTGGTMFLLWLSTVANFNAGQGPEWFNVIVTQLGHGRPLFLFLYIALIVFFAFFYTAIVFNPTETADNLKKHGGFVPGIRPGERTAEYIDYVLSRITVLGAVYLAIVCLIPEILISYASVPFYFGGTSLLIVVSVTMDTVAQVQGYLLAHQYEGLIRKSKLRGRRR